MSLSDVTEPCEFIKLRREFSDSVSHELKTPLTIISALSELIENDMVKDKDIKVFAARISEQAKRLVSIIDDIIRLSEFDKGGIPKDFAVFDLYELVQAVAGSFADNAKGVDIRVTGESLDISANRRMIDELLFNLIDNGVKYNREGGSVAVALSPEDRSCRISVSDTGIGISKEHHNRVFERFYRVNSSRSRKTGGTGLGLSIVKHIVDHHGGRVELESIEDVGTTVTCWFVTGTK